MTKTRNSFILNSASGTFELAHITSEPTAMRIKHTQGEANKASEPRWATAGLVSTRRSLGSRTRLSVLTDGLESVCRRTTGAKSPVITDKIASHTYMSGSSHSPEFNRSRLFFHSASEPKCWWGVSAPHGASPLIAWCYCHCHGGHPASQSLAGIREGQKNKLGGEMLTGCSQNRLFLLRRKRKILLFLLVI